MYIEGATNSISFNPITGGAVQPVPGVRGTNTTSVEGINPSAVGDITAPGVVTGLSIITPKYV